MMNWFHQALLSFLGTLVVNVSAFVPPEYPSMELKMLAVIKQESKAPQPNCSGTLNGTEIDIFADNFANVLPTMIYTMTRGLVRLNSQVVLSPYPLMNVEEDSLMVTADMVPDDIKLFNITAQNFDQIMYVGPQSNWSYHGGISSLGMGWASMSKPDNLRASPTFCGGYLHEMLHGQLRWFFDDARLGNTSQPLFHPGDPDAGSDGTHSAPTWNYTQTTGGDKGIPIVGEPFDEWNKYYMDVLNAEVCMQDAYGDCQDPSDTSKRGMGPAAWKYPSIREYHNNLPAGYMAKYGTYPGQPATNSDYHYTGYTSPRNWKREGDATVTFSTMSTATSVPSTTTSTSASYVNTEASSAPISTARPVSTVNPEGSSAPAPYGSAEGSGVTVSTASPEGSSVPVPYGSAEGSNASVPHSSVEGSSVTVSSVTPEGRITEETTTPQPRYTFGNSSAPAVCTEYVTVYITEYVTPAYAATTTVM
jgi:hypothetical protein